MRAFVCVCDGIETIHVRHLCVKARLWVCVYLVDSKPRVRVGIHAAIHCQTVAPVLLACTRGGGLTSNAGKNETCVVNLIRDTSICRTPFFTPRMCHSPHHLIPQSLSPITLAKQKGDIRDAHINKWPGRTKIAEGSILRLELLPWQHLARLPVDLCVLVQ